MFMRTGSKNLKMKEKISLLNRIGKKLHLKLKENLNVIIAIEIEKRKIVKKIKKVKIKMLDGQQATAHSNF